MQVIGALVTATLIVIGTLAVSNHVPTVPPPSGGVVTFPPPATPTAVSKPSASAGSRTSPPAQPAANTARPCNQSKDSVVAAFGGTPAQWTASSSGWLYHGPAKSGTVPKGWVVADASKPGYPAGNVHHEGETYGGTQLAVCCSG